MFLPHGCYARPVLTLGEGFLVSSLATSKAACWCGSLFLGSSSSLLWRRLSVLNDAAALQRNFSFTGSKVLYSCRARPQIKGSKGREHPRQDQDQRYVSHQLASTQGSTLSHIHQSSMTSSSPSGFFDDDDELSFFFLPNRDIFIPAKFTIK